MEQDANSLEAALIPADFEYDAADRNTTKTFLNLVFAYNALARHAQQIRLLSMSWDHKVNSVRCRLETFDLSEAPSYTALSYTWGKQDPDCTVLLDDMAVRVTRNLQRFLGQAARLRQYRSRKYWIDALCIDQSSTTERTHQVGLMADIYSEAKDVLVWLGPAHSGSQMAMSMQRGQYRREIWSSAAGHHYRLLCERKYWTRLWVVQELQLGREVTILCGNVDLKWADFVRYASAALERRPTAAKAYYTDYKAFYESPAISMINNTRQDHLPRSLFDRVLSFGHLNCADPLDRIYALLGTVDQGKEGIEPNYATPCVDVLHQLLRNHHKIDRPTSLEQVTVQCASLSATVGLHPKAMLSYVDHDGNLMSPSIAARHESSIHEMSTEFVEDDISLSMLWWASYHNFSHVENIWRDHVPKAQLQDLFNMAIRQGKYSMVKFLLEREFVDINVPDSDGILPLHASITDDQADVTALLLHQPTINVNARSFVRVTNHEDSYRVRHPGQHSVLVTPLLLAVALGSKHIVQLLLHHSVLDVNAPEHFVTGLDTTTWFAHLGEHPECFNVKERGAFTLYEGDSPLMKATDLSCISLLLQRPELDLNQKTRANETALSISIEMQRLAAFDKLVSDYRVDVNSLFTTGEITSNSIRKLVRARPVTVSWTPLGRAINTSEFRYLQLLLNRPDLDVNSICETTTYNRAQVEQYTALDVLMQINHGSLDHLKALVARSDLTFRATKYLPETKEWQRSTIFTAAIDSGTEVLQILLESGKSIDYATELKFLNRFIGKWYFPGSHITATSMSSHFLLKKICKEKSRHTPFPLAKTVGFQASRCKFHLSHRPQQQQSRL